ncbi:MAG: hypothetical protein ABW321_30570 [Polyangiales bacterium]
MKRTSRWRGTLVMLGLSACGLAIGVARCDGNAAEVALCHRRVAPYVTDWSGAMFGIQNYAFVRLVTPDAQSTQLVVESCLMARGPFKRVTFPNRTAPTGSWPPWWDLTPGEVHYSLHLLHDGASEGFVYRTETPDGVVWLMFASPS